MQFSVGVAVGEKGDSKSPVPPAEPQDCALLPKGRGITGIPPFIVLHFFMLHRYCVFYQLRVGSKPVLSETIGAIFQQHLLTSHLCHMLEILTIFQTLSLFVMKIVISDYNSLRAQMMFSNF